MFSGLTVDRFGALRLPLRSAGGKPLARPRALPWRRIGLVLVAAASLGMSLPIILSLPTWHVEDWYIFTDAAARVVESRNPYEVEGFIYSPLVAYGTAAIAPIGPVGWTVVGFATLALLRDWRLIGAFLLAWPFWVDISTGMSFLPFPVLAIVAMRGSRLGTLAFVALLCLVPRPAMLPILAWLLWRDRALILPSAVVVAALGLGALATGWTDEWLGKLLTMAGDPWAGRLAVSAILGPLWLLMLPLAVWLTVKGRVGLAALAVSPYWTAAYPMLLLLEYRPAPRAERPDLDDWLRGI